MNETIQKYMGMLFHFSNNLNNYKTNNIDNTNNGGYTRNINTYEYTNRHQEITLHICNNNKIDKYIK